MPPKFRLHGKETQFAGPLAQPRDPANPPYGEQQGDQRVFTDELHEIDATDQPVGPVVGEHSGHGTLVRVGPGNQRIYQAFATFRLADGLLTARTLFDLNNIPGGELKSAITGGTGAHRKARGEINNIFKPGKVTIFEFDLT